MLRSQSLKILSYDGRFDELFIEDAPNLEWVLWDNKSMYRGNAYLVVAQAPKLEFLGYLGTWQLHMQENQILVNTLMASLKTLAVDVKNRGAGYINWFMKLLELFPCLETLYIRSEISPVNHSDAPESWNLLRSIPCVDNSLETVVFEVYRGHKWQREMARFLHMRSRCLKTMEFHCMDDSSFAIYRGPPKEEWVRKQKELLCIDSRASRDMPIFSSSSIRFRLIITICAATNIQKLVSGTRERTTKISMRCELINQAYVGHCCGYLMLVVDVLLLSCGCPYARAVLFFFL
ncbi:hypothetical protein EJB05_17092, partial [Eragrostis curvula]